MKVRFILFKNGVLAFCLETRDLREGRALLQVQNMYHDFKKDLGVFAQVSVMSH